MEQEKIEYANRTLSAWAFYWLCVDALENGKRISTVRMGDGELQLLKWCTGVEDESPGVTLNEEWHQRMGTSGISMEELYDRLMRAGNNCTHFAPNVNGLGMAHFDLYSWFETRTQYLDNFFINIWSEKHKRDLYDKAGHVLFIHRNRGAADAFQRRAKDYLGVKLDYLELSNWTQTDGVIEKAVQSPAKLVLFAGGPASKYLSPEIADISATGKVVIDIGNTTDHWLLYQTEQECRANG